MNKIYSHAKTITARSDECNRICVDIFREYLNCLYVSHRRTSIVFLTLLRNPVTRIFCLHCDISQDDMKSLLNECISIGSISTLAVKQSTLDGQLSHLWK